MAEKMSVEQIEKLVVKYKISPWLDGKMMIRGAEYAKRDGVFDEIAAAKQEILAYFDAKKEAKKAEQAAYKARIDAIEGLAELQAAIDDEERYREEFRYSFEAEDACGGMNVRPASHTHEEIKEMKKAYPHAAAYIRVNAMCRGYSDKATAARKVLDEVIDGNYEEALAKLDAELDEIKNKRLLRWD